MKSIVSHINVGFLFNSFEQFWSSQSKPPSMMEFNGLFKQFQHDFEIHLLQRKDVLLRPLIKTVPKLKRE
jgi:hypothetical protein